MDYYGVDSLVAVELRNWFIKNMDADVAIFIAWAEPVFLHYPWLWRAGPSS